MPTVSLKQCFKQKKVEAQYQQKSGCVERVELTAKTSLQGYVLCNATVIF